MDKEKIETYSPDVTEQVPLGVEGAGEIEHTKINEKVIIQRIAKDLYKDASSGLRELYMNSVRACKDAVKLAGYGYHPRITVTVNEAKRTLIIEDNGIGITEQMYQQVLRELGTSSNLDGGETGQFGMGFASYMTLSSVVIIDTMSVDGTSFKRIAKDGQSFQRLDNSDRKTHGTTLSMTCYDKVNFSVLMEKFHKIARYSGVPTFLMLEEFEYIGGRFNRGINEIEQWRFDDEALNVKTDKQDLVDIETDDFHLIALVAGAYQPINRDHVHLLNVPIESDINLPFNWWVLNIKDERKFLPMPDRDRMRTESDKKLEGIMDIEIKKYFKTLDIMTYQQFIDSDRKNEFLWLCYNNSYARTPMQPSLYNLQNCIVRTVQYGTKKFDDGSLIVKLSTNHDVIYQGYKNQIVTDKLAEFCPTSLPITVKKTKKIPWKKYVATMEAFGIPFARQILIDNKVKIPKAEKSDEEIIGHTNNYTGVGWRGQNYETNMIDPDDIDENVIRIDGEYKMLEVTRFIRCCANPYIFVRNASSLDETDCTSFTEWMKTVGDIVCATNEGAKTVEELTEYDKVYFCQDFAPEYESFVVDSDKLVVYGTNQLLPFKLHTMGIDSSLWEIRNSVNMITVTTIINEKYNVNLNSDVDKKFFCDNLKDIPSCFHELFGKLIKNIDYDIDYGIDEDTKMMFIKDNLKLVKSFEAFDETDELEKLRFYHAQHVTMADDTTALAESLETLMNNSKARIRGNEALLERFVREMLIPKIFGKVVFKKFEKMQLSYQNEYELSLSFVSYNKEFDFHDDVKVYDFDVMTKGLKFRVTKQYVGIKLSVSID